VFDAGTRSSGATHSTSSSPEQVTLDQAGTYLVVYTVAATDLFSVQNGANYRLVLDGTEVQGSSVQCTNNSPTLNAVTSHMCIATGVTAGQVLELQGGPANPDWDHYYSNDCPPVAKVMHSITAIRIGD